MTIEQEPAIVIVGKDVLLLLSPDRKLAGSHGEQGGECAPTAIQLTFDGLGVSPRVTSVTPRLLSARPTPDPATAALLAGFARRLIATGASPKTQAAYRFQIDQLLAAARRNGLGTDRGLLDLFRDEALLGVALTDDTSANHGMLSRWTLAQRRTAVRAFVRLMSPELRLNLAVDPETAVVWALRRVAERVGGGHRLTGGAPRRRGGPAPTSTEVATIISESARAPGFKGARNRAFFTVLHETGCRVNALRSLDGNDVFVLPNGRMRLMLHQKGRSARREVELLDRSATLLREYVAAFGDEAARAGRSARIEFGGPGPVWRSGWRARWAYKGVAQVFARACEASGARAYAPHALRRGFASDAESTLPRHVVALAGGWRGLERLDNHYVHRRDDTIRRKLTDPRRDDVRVDDHEYSAPAL